MASRVHALFTRPAPSPAEPARRPPVRRTSLPTVTHAVRWDGVADGSPCAAGSCPRRVEAPGALCEVHR